MVSSTFRWATVTQISPLRIRLDGDTTALGFTPDSLVDPASLAVSDRTRCELSDRRVIIAGRSQGDGGGFIGEHKAGEWATTPHPSWVLANGAVLNIADYPRLAAHYAAVYGLANFHDGNGTTTFAVPDTRERTYVNQGGVDIFATIGAKTGTKTHTLTVAEMPSHTHPAAYYDGSADNGQANRARLVSGIPLTSDIQRIGNTGGGGAHNNVQPSFVCRFVIRAA